MGPSAYDGAERDALLVARAREGDIAAWGHVCFLYQEQAFRAARLVARSGHEAEDVTRDALVRAYRALHTFRDGEPLRPWLLRIVAGEARSRRREAGRHSPTGSRSPAAPGPRMGPGAPAGVGPGQSRPGREGGAPGGGPIGPVLPALGRPLLREEQEVLIGALDGLVEDDRLVIGCHFLLDMPDEETATILDVAADTVAERRDTAIGRLRGRLAAVR